MIHPAPLTRTITSTALLMFNIDTFLNHWIFYLAVYLSLHALSNDRFLHTTLVVDVESRSFIIIFLPSQFPTFIMSNLKRIFRIINKQHLIAVNMNHDPFHETLSLVILLWYGDFAWAPLGRHFHDTSRLGFSNYTTN
jgi:hypothetical protein